VQLEE
jgi:hypothetical protein